MIVFATKAALDDYVNAIVAQLVIEHRATSEELLRKSVGNLSGPSRTIAENITRRLVRSLADRVLRPLPAVPLPRPDLCTDSLLPVSPSSPSAPEPPSSS